jgi:hypothetical protein
MLGVEDRLGSLEVGKAGYVVVFSGDPLDFNSWVEKAYIDGVLAYDRAKDVRLKELLGLEEKFAKKKAEPKKPDAEQKKKEEEEKEKKDKEKPAQGHPPEDKVEG